MSRAHRDARRHAWRRRAARLTAGLLLAGACAAVLPSAAGAQAAPPGPPSGAPGGQGTLLTAPAVARPGEVVALAGSPHLWVGGEDGLFHWVADSRALTQHRADWATRRDLAAADVQALPRGEPWLSAPLVRLVQEGGAILLPKWETGEARPTLLHIRSIEDVRLFGISQDNWGRLVREEPAWEAATGLPLSTLPRGVLPPAVPVAPVPALAAPAPPAPPGGPEGSPRGAWWPVPQDGALAASNREFVTRTVDGVAWTWVPYWYVQVGRDDRLMDALVLAATVEPEYRARVAANLAGAETRLVWGDLPGSALGRHRAPLAGGPGVITVHSRLQGDPGGTAAVVAHEVVHAQYSRAERRLGTSEAAAACVREEAVAFEWQARVWVSLPNGLKLDSGLQEFMNRLARLWQAGVLAAAVGDQPGYQAQCALR